MIEPLLADLRTIGGRIPRMVYRRPIAGHRRGGLVLRTQRTPAPCTIISSVSYRCGFANQGPWHCF